MLSKEVRFDGFTTEDWIRLTGLASSESPSPGRAGYHGLLLVHDGRRLAKAWHSARGRLSSCEGSYWPVRLDRLAHQHAARWVIAAHVEGLRVLSERFGSRLRQRQTLAEQLELVRNIARELVDEGRIAVWPRSLDLLTRLRAQWFSPALSWILPRGKTHLLALVSEGALFTSVAFSFDARGLSRISGPVPLRPLLPGARSGFGALCETIERAAIDAFGPLGLALYADLSVARRLAADPSLSQFALAQLRGELHVSYGPATPPGGGAGLSG